MKKKGVLIAAAVLAGLIAAGLWYTRPRSFHDITGTQQEAGSLSITFLDYSGQKNASTWLLEYEPLDSPAAGKILRALDENTYRVDLGSLLEYLPFTNNQVIGREASDGDGDMILRLDSSDRRAFHKIILDNHGVMLLDLPGGGPALRCRADPELFQELAQLMREYGTFQED